VDVRYQNAEFVKPKKNAVKKTGHGWVDYDPQTDPPVLTSDLSPEDQWSPGRVHNAINPAHGSESRGFHRVSWMVWETVSFTLVVQDAIYAG
jgi:hypothetical protein